MTIQRVPFSPHLSKYVIANNTLYASGQTPDDGIEDFEAQAASVLQKIDAILAAVGIDRFHLLSATVWLDDYRKWDRFNVVWDAWVPTGHEPARSCVESKLCSAAYQVEVAVIASLTR